jgi:hypothetical protein
MVLVQVQRTHLEEGEQAEVDFHPHCHHLKKKPDHKKAQTSEDGSQAEEGTITELGLQAKRFSSNLTSLLIIISLQCD